MGSIKGILGAIKWIGFKEWLGLVWNNAARYHVLTLPAEKDIEAAKCGD